MADFPLVLSNIVDNATPILAKYINNIETKVGINGSVNTSSVDYKLTNVIASTSTNTTNISTLTTKLSGVSTGDKAASLIGAETLTHKVLTDPVLPRIYTDENRNSYLTFPTLVTDSVALVATAQTLLNKTLTNPVIPSIYQDAGQTRLMTIPNVTSDTFVMVAATQTLTNKTLTSPKLNEAVAITSTATEVNVLHGLTATQSELNLLHGNLGAWTSFNPSWTNFTIGNGTHTGRYCQIGKTIHFSTMCAMANDSSINGAMVMTLPVTPASAIGNITIVGQICYYDGSGGQYFGVVWANGQLYLLNATGTYTVLNGTSSNVPFDVVAGDFIAISGTYEAA